MSVSCPRHARVMDRLTVAVKEGGERVELDRCADCGALWFDVGELEVVAEVTARLAEGASTHPCPRCATPMSAATVAGGLEAHRCDDCHGTWLDGDTVRSLARSELPQAPTAANVGFLCASCGDRFPYAEGNGTNKGLVCRGCVVNPRPGRLRRGEATHVFDSPLSRQDDAYTLRDAIESIAELFGD